MCGRPTPTKIAHRKLAAVGMTADRESRNAVLFPRKIGGRYLRLERPNRVRQPGGVATGDRIVLAESADLVDWSIVGAVIEGRPHYWDEWIGSGPPPVRVREGWLHLFGTLLLREQATFIHQAMRDNTLT